MPFRSLVSVLAILLTAASLAAEGPESLGPLLWNPAAARRASVAAPLRLAPDVRRELPPLSGVERAFLDRSSGERAEAIGVVRGVEPAVARGALRLAGGARVWSASIRSAGATGIRLQLRARGLPAASRLFVYAAGGQARGPYTPERFAATGDFWTGTVDGDEVTVELQLPPGREPGEDFEFAVTGVAHLERPVVPAPASNACMVDYACVTSSGLPFPALAEASNAVAQLTYLREGKVWLCSGGLLNNTLQNGRPYLLTANHCFSTQEVASTLEALFFFRDRSCSPGPWPPPGGFPAEELFPSTVGATLLASSISSDFTLVRLAEAAPEGSAFLGWSRADITAQSGLDLYRLSHPHGWPQFYTHEQVRALGTACLFLPRGRFLYSGDVDGATEGGSSGSLLFDSSLRVVGQLYGSCGRNSGDACDRTNDAIDGAFAATWPSVAMWLDPDPNCSEPSIVAQPVPASVRAGGSATLSVAAQGSAPLAYQWYAGAPGNLTSPVPGATSATLVTPPVTATRSYWARVSNGCGFADSDSATITPVPPSRRRAIER